VNNLQTPKLSTFRKKLLFSLASIVLIVSGTAELLFGLCKWFFFASYLYWISHNAWLGPPIIWEDSYSPKTLLLLLAWLTTGVVLVGFGIVMMSFASMEEE